MFKLRSISARLILAISLPGAVAYGILGTFSIQAATGNCVSAIGGISDTIREISGIATTIAAAVEEQDSATREIARSVQ